MPEIKNAIEQGYPAARIREIDRIAIEQYGMDGFELMSRAARGAFTALLQKWPDTKSICAFCGTGNNGGDALVLSALARQAGLQATALVCGKIDKITGTAREALDFALAKGVEVVEANGRPFPDILTRPLIIVDGLLGTGTTGSPRNVLVPAIETINESGCPVLSLDLPSGMDADTGDTPGVCVKADLTVTFIAMKTGLQGKLAKQNCGDIIIDDLDLPPEIFEAEREHHTDQQ